ncbi:MAG: hypothetical protein AAGB22_06710, partial [Bacteroidota bacterium]
MTALNHSEQYRNRIRNLTATRDAQRQRSAMFSALRLGVVLATALGVYLAWPGAAGVTAVALPGVVVFLLILKQHQRVKRTLRHTETLIRLNEWELAAQGGDHSNFEDGKAFRQLEHPFAHDLDLFGPRSIFQLINRTSTASGQAQLADWLQAPCTDPAQLRQRQEAVAELTPQLDWRQDLWAVGMQFGLTGGERDGLLQWVQRPVTIAQGGLYTVLLWLLPALALGSLAAYLLDVLTFMQFLIAPVALLAFVGAHVKKVNREMEEVGRMHEQLEGYARLWQMLEDQQPNAPFLKAQREGLQQGPRSATKAIRHLGNILESLDVRNNPIGAMIVNGFFLWDLHHMRRLAGWKARYRQHLATWFAVTGTWDALCSLAQLAYNRPDFTYPELRETGNELQLEGAGHPLMRPGTCTLNDWGLSGRAQLTILTGANMAGKSTFLRRVGVNMMLAMAGGPVTFQVNACCLTRPYFRLLYA